MRQIILIIFIIISSSYSLSAQETKVVYKVLYDYGHSTIDTTYHHNETNLNQIKQVLESTINRPLKINITGSSSPTGQYTYNIELAQKRINSLTAFIKSNISEHIPIITKNNKIDWEYINTIFEEYENQKPPPKELEIIEKIRNIINNSPEFTRDSTGKVIDSRVKQLKDLMRGKAWFLMAENIFPRMRYSHATITFQPPTLFSKFIHTSYYLEEKQENLQLKTRGSLPAKIFQNTNALFFLKTNILADAATILNIGIEVPLSRRWSIETNYYHPWWRNIKHNFTLQGITADLGVKYWFPKENQFLQGWWLGISSGVGYNDIQLFQKWGKQSSIKNYYQENVPSKGDIKIFPYPWKSEHKKTFTLTRVQISLIWRIYHHKNK